MVGFVHEFRKKSLWIGTFAEFLATFLFVFLGIGSAVTWNPSKPPSIEHISLCFGLSIATLAITICHLSGGLINPAVTIAQLVSRKISPLRAVLFLIAQNAGGKGLFVSFFLVNGLGVTIKYLQFMHCCPTNSKCALANFEANCKLAGQH